MMKVKYIFPLFFGALMLVIGCQQKQDVQPKMNFYKSQAVNHQLIQPDLLAHQMINEEPDIFLLDIRSEEAFDAYSLPNSMNIPLASWAEKKEELEMLSKGQLKVILIDQNGTDARFASFYLEHSDMLKPYILDGGLDAWVETIFMVQPSDESLDDDQQEIFKFREAAAMYFTGMSKAIEPTTFTGPVAKKSVKVVPKKKKTINEEEEGC
jgi:rhodanese-related sulfurtransferase